MKSKLDLMKEIRDEVFNLKSSPLYKYRTENNFFAVIGAGSHDAHIMFVGEAPGANEAKKGIPFCGASGKFLDEMLSSISLDRSKVYITNLVKDRPEDNRDPLPTEIELYSPFLDRQIEIIKPSVIVCLGRHSMNYIMKKYGFEKELLPISKIHGKVFKNKEIDIICLYHPAVALYNGSMRKLLLEDFKVLKTYI